jgi:TonB-linked SusC/RagA family outer membrane protein
VWSSALVYNPTFPSHRNTESGLWDVEPAAQSMTTHPGEMMDTRQEREFTRVTASGRATYQIIDGLTVGAFGSFNLTNSLAKNYYRNDVSGYAGVRGQAGVANENGKEWLGNLQLNYVKQAGKHSINALALVEAQKEFMFENGATVQGFDTNYFMWNNLEAGAVINWGNVTSSAVQSTLLSWLGRVNYMLDDKYVVTLNARADGSSKLGKNHKWGFFPSVSAAWILTNESFMKEQRLFQNLKFRVSYGVTGNQSAISPLNSLELMEPTGLSSYNSQSVVTYGIIRNSNPDLKWEVKQTFDIGFDASMLRSRLRATFDYYRSTTRDMLYTYSVSVPPFVYSTLLANLGEMTNNGFELSLAGEPIQNRDWRLSLRGNLAYNKNNLVSLQGTYMGEEFTTPEWINVSSQGGAGMVGNTGVTYMAEGHPVGVFRLPVHDGFDTDADGRKMYRFKDLDNSGSIDLGDMGDRDILGQVVPKFTANLGAQLRYKRFDLAVQTSAAFGHHIYNFTTMALSNMNMFPVYNVLDDAPERNIYDIKHTSYWLEKGDYVNIEYITLGYNFPASRNGLLSGARVAVSCNNVATITGYSGLTPLINSANFRSGIDARNVTPLQRTWTMQLILNF